MLKQLEKTFEKLIVSSRFMILVAVFFGIISTLAMIILGSVNAIAGISKLGVLFANFSQADEIEKTIVKQIISAVDAYLIATVLLIFSIGLYELFISKLTNPESRSYRVLIIRDLDQLKENLAKVIIIVLIVTYFQFALEMHYTNTLDLLYLSAGILLVALSVFLIRHRDKDKKDSKTDHTE
jgi:uncharacterized membrane protein YqhA